MTLDATRRMWLFGVITAISLVASLVLAAWVGLDLARLKGGQKEVSALRARVATFNTPPVPSKARPLVAGPPSTLEPQIGEVLNTRLSDFGMQVVGIDMTTRRPLGRGLELQSATVRARGSAEAGLKVLSWLKANERAVSVESVTAHAGPSGAAEWTFILGVLAAPDPAEASR